MVHRGVLVGSALFALLVAGCNTAAPGHGSPAAQVATPAATAAPVAALATDQACTRRAADGSTLQSVRVRPDDLQAMTLPRSSLPSSVRGYPTDWNSYGFIDNVEMPQVQQVGPTNLCAINRTYGRIVGFTRAYSGAQSVWTADHLFFSATDAAGWLAAYVAGMRALPGHKGISSVRVTSLASSLGTGAVKITSRCSSGCTLTHVLFRRGQIIGSVWDGHGSGVGNAIDVVAVAKQLATRIAGRASSAASRAPDGYDAVMQLSAGLPKAALGTRYAPLTWDWLFGGCWDVAEAATQTNSPAEATAYTAAATRFGQLTYCRAMYEAAPGKVTPVERAFTGGTLYTTAAGAHGALLKALADAKARAGRTVGGTSYGAVLQFSPGSLGDETVGFRQRAGTTYMTRALIRRGRYVETAALNARYFSGMVADVSRWAKLLDRRVALLTSTRAF